MTSPDRAAGPDRAKEPRPGMAGASGEPFQARGERLGRPLNETTAFRVTQRRRDRIVAEIEKNRRGEHAVPTWVLALILLALVGGWAALIFLV